MKLFTHRMPRSVSLTACPALSHPTLLCLGRHRSVLRRLLAHCAGPASSNSDRSPIATSTMAEGKLAEGRPKAKAKLIADVRNTEYDIGEHS
jgi:hypothetical protein